MVIQNYNNSLLFTVPLTLAPRYTPVGSASTVDKVNDNNNFVIPIHITMKMPSDIVDIECVTHKMDCNIKGKKNFLE